MLKENKELYNYYINMRNNYIKNNYKTVTNIEEILNNESIYQKYDRFLNLGLIDDVSLKIDNIWYDITGFSSYIYTMEPYDGRNVCSMLLREILINNSSYIYDYIVDQIKHYINIDHSNDDELYFEFEDANYANSLFNYFNITSQDSLKKWTFENFNKYLEYIGLDISDL